MLALTIFVTFGKAKINYVNIVFGHFSSTDKEVIRFNISVDNSLLVNFFESLHHLLGNEAAGLQVEFTFALHEQVFQTGPQHIHDHYVKLILFICFVSSNII